MRKFKQKLLSAVMAGILLFSGCSGRLEEGIETEGTALPTADYDLDEEKYGYRGGSGEWVVKPRFDYADEFTANGLARVQSGGKWGFIKPDGTYAIEPRFDYADSFGEDGTACVAVDRRTDGRGLSIGGKWGFLTEDGAYLIEPCFDWAGGFGEDGFAPVILDGNRGRVNRAGDFTPDP